MLPKKTDPKNPNQGNWLKGLLGLVLLPVFILVQFCKATVRYFWNAPMVIKLLMLALVLGMLALGALSSYRLIRNRLDNRPMLEQELRTAMNELDEVKIKSAIEKLITNRPNDIQMRKRLEAISTGSGVVEDDDFCLLLALLHNKNGRGTEASNEALKRLEKVPGDWTANCFVALEHIKKNELEKAMPYLKQIEDPNNGTSPQISMVQLAIELRSSAKLECSQLRNFVQMKILPIMRNQNLVVEKPDIKNHLIYMYVSSVQGANKTAIEDLLQFWANVSQLSEQIVNDSIETKNHKALKTCGELQIKLLQCVNRFRKENSIDAAMSEKMSKELDERGEKIWTGMKQIKPEDSSGYAGMGGLLLKKNEFSEAEKVVIEGIQKVGPYPELIRLLIYIDERKGNSDRALNYAMMVAKKNPDIIDTWRVLIDAARLARRRDIAIEACQEMRKLRTDMPFALMAEGILWLEAGEPKKSLDCISKLPAELKQNEAVVSSTYLKALIQDEQRESAWDYFEKTFEQSEIKANSALAFTLLQAMSQSKDLSVPELDKLIKTTDRFLLFAIDDSSIIDQANWMKADFIFQTASQSNPRWDVAKMESAIRAYEVLINQHPNDIRGFTRLAIIQIEGQKNSDAAYETANKLAKLTNQSIESRITIAHIYNVKNKFELAIQFLEPIISSPQVSSIALTEYAKALAGKGEVALAKNVLIRAGTLKMSDRERETYREVANLVNR